MGSPALTDTPISTTAPVSMAQETSLKRGWNDSESQNPGKSATKQPLLEMAAKTRLEQLAISMDMNMERKESLRVSPVDKELWATN